MDITVTSARDVAPLSVEVNFSDGALRTADVGAFIKNHPHVQYNSCLDEGKFKGFRIEMGDIVWGDNWDLVFPISNLYTGELD